MNKQDTFEAFFKENYAKFCIFAFRYINDEDACRDIVSAGFEYVLKHFDDDDIENWRGYMLKYIHNKCIDHLRHEAVHKRYANFYLASAEVYAEDLETHDDRIMVLRKLMDTLSAKTRLVLQECFVNRKTYKEVADELEISVSAVHKHIMKALKTLREGVKKQQTGVQ